MPLYEYKCDVCGRFEKIVQFSDPPLAACPTCGGTVQKLFSSPAIQFKGSGFYITDYAKAKKVSPESSQGTASDKSSSDKSSDKSSGEKSAGEKSSGEKPSRETSSSGDKSAGGKSSGDSSSTSAPAAPTSSKD